jgi:hypothetical protein
MFFWARKEFDCTNKMCYFNIISYLAQSGLSNVLDPFTGFNLKVR